MLDSIIGRIYSVFLRGGIKVSSEIGLQHFSFREEAMWWSPLDMKALIVGFVSFVVLLARTMISINRNLKKRLSGTKAAPRDKSKAPN